MTYNDIKQTYESANVMGQLFPNEPTKDFRKYASIIHPDQAPTGKEKEYNDLFALISTAHDSAKYDPHYKTRPLKETLVGTPVSTKIGKIVLTKLVAKNSIYSCYLFDKGYVRISSHPSNNDLITNEADILKRIHTVNGHGKLQEFINTQRAYVTKCLDSLTLNSASKHYACNVLQHVDCHPWSYEQIITKYPKGLEIEHVWWITRRNLMTLKMLNILGVQHNSVNPRNLWVADKEHGTLLLDFTNGSIGNKPKYKDPTYPDLSPTDLIGLMNSTVLLATGNLRGTIAHEPTQKIIEQVRSGNLLDAWQVHEELGKVIGPSKYRELTL